MLINQRGILSFRGKKSAPLWNLSKKGYLALCYRDFSHSLPPRAQISAVLSAIRPLGGLRCTLCPPAEKDADPVSNGSPLNAGSFVPDNVAEAKPYRAYGEPTRRSMARKRQDPERGIFRARRCRGGKAVSCIRRADKTKYGAKKTSSVIRSCRSTPYTSAAGNHRPSICRRGRDRCGRAWEPF